MFFTSVKFVTWVHLQVLKNSLDCDFVSFLLSRSRACVSLSERTHFEVVPSAVCPDVRIAPVVCGDVTA